MNSDPIIVAFFHPHCSAFGGGERVLWKAIQALGELQEPQRPHEERIHGNIAVVIYTIDVPTVNYRQDLLNKVQERFSIRIPSSLSLSFVHLHEEASILLPPQENTKAKTNVKRFSLIGESIQSMKFAWCAFKKCTPHVFIDTTGYAFTYLIAKVLVNCHVVSYVHYPTISTDMLALVWERRPTYNNTSIITQSVFMTYLKLGYYLLFALAYGMVGSLADIVMVNSSWTFRHVHQLWRLARKRMFLVYPPCDIQSHGSHPQEPQVQQTPKRLSVSSSLPLLSYPQQNIRDKDTYYIVSIGQFRPEKDHALQIRSFAKFLSLYYDKIHNDNCKTTGKKKVQLVLIGSCRCQEDEERVMTLRSLCASLHVSDSVVFVLNQPYPIVHEWFQKSIIGLHTMWNEHFGIGIVEMMAAGLIVVAHASGGPKTDIIVPKTNGYLASTEEEYAHCFYTVLQDENEEFANEYDSGMNKNKAKNVNERIRQAAHDSIQKFSDEEFVSTFQRIMIHSNLLRHT